MIFVMCAKYFFEAQAKDLPEKSKLKHLVKHNLIKQDNTSAIQLKQNSKHDIRYFYVTDKIKDGTVEVTYKKTIDMPSNYLTKSLTDNLFKKHLAVLLGLDSVTYAKQSSFYINYKDNCDKRD